MDPLLGDFDLRAADIGSAVQDLALEVREIDDVIVDQTDAPHAGGGEVQRTRASQATGTHQQHTALQEFALSFDAELRKIQVAPVAIELIGPEKRVTRHGWTPSEGCRLSKTLAKWDRRPGLWGHPWGAISLERGERWAAARRVSRRR